MATAAELIESVRLLRAEHERLVEDRKRIAADLRRMAAQARMFARQYRRELAADSLRQKRPTH